MWVVAGPTRAARTKRAGGGVDSSGHTRGETRQDRTKIIIIREKCRRAFHEWMAGGGGLVSAGRVPSASRVWWVMNVRVVSVGERAPGGSIQATTHPE